MFKLISKIICFITFFICGSIIFLGLFIFSTKLFLSNDQFNYFVNSSLVFAKQNMQKDSSNFLNEPNLFRKFFTHLNLVFKLNKGKKDEFFLDNILTFKVKFPNYFMMHQLFYEIFIRKIYAFHPQNDSPIIIDAGSNVGMSILFFKKFYPKAKIIGFEPSQKYYDVLKYNLEINNIKNVDIHKVALSDKVGEFKLYDQGSMTGSLKPENLNCNYDTVKTVLLSDFIKNEKIDLLKIDIEGAETEVIKDLADKNKLNMINEVIMEYHYNPLESKLSEMLLMFENAGFAYIIKNNEPTPFEKNMKRQAFLIYFFRP